MPNRPDETLAPLLTMTTERLNGLSVEGFNRRVLDLLAEVDAQRRLSAEKDATLADMRKERDSLVAALTAAMCPRCDQTIMRGHAPDCDVSDA